MAKVEVERLLLDPENPRLPEELHGAPQSALFDYLYDNGVLDELAESMLDNGFFEHEPIIILPPNKSRDHIVVEGNRRLAALMLIHRHPATGERSLPQQPTPEQLASLKEVPVFEVPDREEVRRFLGYRHISGLKPWKPEAKARYIAAEVDSAYRQGISNPLLHVARRVGSNTQGIRSSYVALSMLRYAENACIVWMLTALDERIACFGGHHTPRLQHKHGWLGSEALFRRSGDGEPFQKGLKAGNLGRARRSSSGLAEAVYEVGERCGLSPSADRAIIRLRAQEEGVDVIAHLKWTDSRPLHWVFVVQATSMGAQVRAEAPSRSAAKPRSTAGHGGSSL